MATEIANATAPAAGGVLQGKVKWFNSTKGFGFITPDDGTDDIFVHQTSIKAEGFRSLAEGEPVEYTIDNSDNGRPKAVNVTGPNGENVKGAPRNNYGGGRGGDRYGAGYGGGYGAGFGGGFGGRGRGGRRGGFGGGMGDRNCYNCNQPGHLARDCPNGPGAGGGGPAGGRACYNCHEPGHLARDCPNQQQ